MTSWQTLLLLDMAQGKYLCLSPRPTPYNWWTLWGLAHETYPEVRA